MIDAIRRFASHLTQLELWAVAFFVALSLATSRALPAAVGAAAAFWLARGVAYGRLSQRTPADLGMLVLLAAAGIAVGISPTAEKTIPQVVRLLSGMALYYAIVNWCNNEKRLLTILWGLLGIGLILAGLAPFSVDWSVGKLPFIPTDIYEGFTQLLPDSIHPNVLGGFLAIFLPIGAAWLLFGKQGWLARIITGLSLLAILGVLGLTASRGAWMAAGAALALLPMLRWRHGWIGLAAAAVAAGAAALILAQRGGWTEVVDMLVSSNTVSGMNGRMEIWSRAIYMIQDFPLTGIGMGAFTETADGLYPFFIAEQSHVAHTHNLFLQVGVDLGIPGLTAWLAVLGSVTAAAWRLYREGRKRGSGLMAAIGAGVLCSQAALIVHGMTDAVVWGMVKPAPLVWGVWGLAMAAARVYAQPGEGAKADSLGQTSNRHEINEHLDTDCFPENSTFFQERHR